MSKFTISAQGLRFHFWARKSTAYSLVSRMIHILLLLIAISAEVAATTLLKSSEGLTRIKPVIGVALGYGISFSLLAYVLKYLPVGPVYAAWAGIGTAGAAIIGLLAFEERLSSGAWVGIGFIAVGVALLGWFTPHSD